MTSNATDARRTPAGDTATVAVSSRNCRSVSRAVASICAAGASIPRAPRKRFMQAQHEGVAADERVTRQTVALGSRAPRTRGLALRPRHVAALAAAAFVIEGAVLPLLEVHLLRQRADDLPVRPEGLSDQRVAGRTELGLPHVRRRHLLEPCHRTHDRLPSRDRRRTARRSRARRRAALDEARSCR